MFLALSDVANYHRRVISQFNIYCKFNSLELPGSVWALERFHVELNISWNIWKGNAATDIDCNFTNLILIDFRENNMHGLLHCKIYNLEYKISRIFM